MKGLSLTQLSEVTAGGETTGLQWFHELAGGGQVGHHLTYSPGTEIAPRYPGALLLRFLCHYLVDGVPDAGMPELIEATLSVFESYQVPRSSLIFSVPDQRRVLATQGRAFDSPGFQIEPE